MAAITCESRYRSAADPVRRPGRYYHWCITVHMKFVWFVSRGWNYRDAYDSANWSEHVDKATAELVLSRQYGKLIEKYRRSSDDISQKFKKFTLIRHSKGINAPSIRVIKSKHSRSRENRSKTFVWSTLKFYHAAFCIDQHWSFKFRVMQELWKVCLQVTRMKRTLQMSINRCKTIMRFIFTFAIRDSLKHFFQYRFFLSFARSNLRLVDRIAIYRDISIS